MKHIAQTLRKTSSACYWVVIIHLVLLAICMVGLLIDDRMLMGINVWLKPFKFVISGTIYIATVGYLLSLYPFSSKKIKVIDNIVAWTLLFEILIIVGQGARGVQSHYNESSLIDGVLFGFMGFFIAINVIIMAFMLIETVRLKMKVNMPMRIAIGLGWVIVLFGSAVGGQMIGQMAHNVGVVDGGKGIPFLNWSTIAGDLRIAHFFGLHGIQILPLVALGISKMTSWTIKSRNVAIIVFGILYILWIGFTFCLLYTSPSPRDA